MTVERTKLIVEVDVDWYLSMYADARERVADGEFVNALDHYLKVGMRAGYLPKEPEVNARWYLARYPDVALACNEGHVESAKQHYIKYGYREGRFPCPPEPQKRRFFGLIRLDFAESRG